MITVDILKAIAPRSKRTGYKLLAPLAEWMNYWFPKYEIDSRGELCHFTTQAAHETDSFNSLEEYASGDAYDTRTDLGNTPEKDGDGSFYKGRGIFMTTGRLNYRVATIEWAKRKPATLIDFGKEPEHLEWPQFAVWSACQYWSQRNFNVIANMADDAKVPYKLKGKIIMVSPVEYISRKINGGTRGLDDRKMFYERAKSIIT